jgi:membrane protease YdiL (CAAX protease family)
MKSRVTHLTYLQNCLSLNDCKINKMSEKHRFSDISGESPLYQIFISVMIILCIGFFLTIIFIAAGTLIIGANLNVLTKTSASFTDNDIVFIRYALIIQDISFLLIPAIVIMSMINQPGTRLKDFKVPEFKEIILVIILTLCLLPVTSFTGQINSAIHLPAWLSGIENWMREKEESADNIIDSIVVSDTFWIMSLNLIIIGLIPAITEEMIFRGVFQKIFSRLFRSGHLAIWITAFIFSAIHFQFLGFIPRFILGLIFGYLFFWGGTLWLPIISHFVNNAFPVILTYVQGIEKTNASPDIPLWKQAVALPIPIMIISIILFYFRKKNLNPFTTKEHEGNTK